MKIAFVAMASSNHTAKWVEYFRDQGNDVILISFYPGPEIDRVRTINIKTRGRFGMILKVGYVKKLLREFRPDILHAHYASSCGIVAALTGYRPFVLSTWGDDVMVFPHKSFLHRWAVGKVIRRADFVTATSEILRTRTKQLVSGDKEVQVVPFGVDLNRFAYVDRTDRDSFHIGAVRWLTHKYGIDYLVKAVAQLVPAYPGLKLTVVGRGYMLKELQQLACSLKIDKHVTFTGPLPNEEVAQLFKQFDLFTMPSVSEGETFGVAAVEAMATGLPVVASRIGGLPEVVDDGVTGKLIQPADVDSLKKGLEFYLSSKADRLEHGRMGRKRVEELFDWKKNAATMDQLYKDFIALRT